MRATVVTDQQRVAIGEVARARRLAMGADLPAIGVVRAARRNALRNDPARRVLAEMDHLGAGIHLLAAVRDGDRVELAARFIAAQDAGRILPGDGGARLDLRPRNLRTVAAAVAALGHEIVDAALALGIAGEPVLHRRIFDLGVLVRDQLDDGGVQLVLVALRGRAALKIGHIRAGVRDDQRALELPGVALVDAEVGRQFHRAAHARRNVDEGAVGEDRRVQRGVIIVGHRHDRAEILLHEFGVRMHGFRDRAEDHAGLGEFGAEGRRDGDGIEHGVDGHARILHARQNFLLAKGNAELLVGAQQLGIDLVQRLRPGHALGRRIIVEVLEVDLRVFHPRPGRLVHGQPAPIGVEAPFGHPFRFVLLCGNEANDILVQPLGRLLGFDLGDEPVLIGIHVDRLHAIDGLFNSRHNPLPCAVSRAAGRNAYNGPRGAPVQAEASPFWRLNRCFPADPRQYFGQRG